MTRLIALDTETTGLDPTVDEVFEIACVDVADGREWRWTVQPFDATVEQMHPKAAEVNRYHERTTDPDWAWDMTQQRPPYESWSAWVERCGTVLDRVGDVLDGAHIIGAVPDFDTRFLTAWFSGHGLAPPRWHYHLIDVEVLAVGWLLRERRLADKPDYVLSLPYDSDKLAAWCGVEPPSDDERHTALGDARWVARWYRTLRGEA